MVGSDHPELPWGWRPLVGSPCMSTLHRLGSEFHHKHLNTLSARVTSGDTEHSLRPGIQQEGWRGLCPPGAGGGGNSLPPQTLLLRKLACSLLPASSQLGSPRAGRCGQWCQFTYERCLVAGLVMADMLWPGRVKGQWLGGTSGGSGLPAARSPPGCE